MFRWVGSRQGPGAVHRIEVPDDVRSRSTLQRVDYADAFVTDVEVQRLPAEAWVRTMLSDAPFASRATLVAGWSSLGLHLGRGPATVLGWGIEASTPDVVLLGARSRVGPGLSAQLLLIRRAQGLVFSTFVAFHSAPARRLWSVVEPIHARVVPELLEDARARARTTSS